MRQLSVVDEHRAFIAMARNTLFVTRDGGRHWREALPASTNDSVTDQGFIAAHFVDRVHGWALLGDTVYRTHDGGRHWRTSRLR
jgi:photosystem II stability/assembly factor-like uncharacterized protein